MENMASRIFIGIATVVLTVLLLVIIWPPKEVEQPIIENSIIENTIGTDCDFTEIIFYHSEHCGWCQKVKDERSIDKLREIGISVELIDVNKDVVKHQFQVVPTFVVNEMVYSGYRTLDELKDLLGCE